MTNGEVSIRGFCSGTRKHSLILATANTAWNGGDLVHRVDQVQALDTVRVALMHRVDSQIAGLALRCRFAPLTDLEADRPGLVDAAALGPVLAQVVRWPLEIIASRS